MMMMIIIIKMEGWWLMQCIEPVFYCASLRAHFNHWECGWTGGFHWWCWFSLAVVLQQVLQQLTNGWGEFHYEPCTIYEQLQGCFGFLLGTRPRLVPFSLCSLSANEWTDRLLVAQTAALTPNFKNEHQSKSRQHKCNGPCINRRRWSIHI